MYLPRVFTLYVLLAMLHACGNAVQQSAVAMPVTSNNETIPENLAVEAPPVAENFPATLTESLCTVTPQYPDGIEGEVKWAIKGSGNCGPDTEELASNDIPDGMVRVTTGEMVTEEVPCIGTMWTFPETFQLSGTGHFDISFGNATGIADCSYPGTGYPSCHCKLDSSSNPECEYKIGLTKSTEEFKADPANKCVEP